MCYSWTVPDEQGAWRRTRSYPTLTPTRPLILRLIAAVLVLGALAVAWLLPDGCGVFSCFGWRQDPHLWIRVLIGVAGVLAALVVLWVAWDDDAVA